MMINTILFRPQNDDPSLQLLCIVQYVGGLTLSTLDRFPLHIKKLFSKTKCDSHQQRLHRLLQQIFKQYSLHFNENLFDLLKQMFQFQSDKRLSLDLLLEHPFYSLKRISYPKTHSLIKPSVSIRLDDLVHLCTKLQLKQSRWILTLKERCLFELILHIKNFNDFNPEEYGLSQLLQFEIKKLIFFLTGN